MRGVQRIMDKDEYCIDTLRQPLAVQRNIDKVNVLIVENRLET